VDDNYVWYFDAVDVLLAENGERRQLGGD